MNEELNGILKSLADGWCEQKALGPLSRFLPGYLSINGLTDGWALCRNALKDVRALHRDRLKPEEVAKLNKAINLIDQMLDF